MKDSSLRKTFGVYSITCRETLKVYIGSTSASFYKRWDQHKRSLRKGDHCNPYLQNAWNKYGEESFDFAVVEIIEIKDKTIIVEREQFHMNDRKATESDFGYNSNPTAGSRLGSKASEKTLEKLRGKTPWNKGKSGEYSLGPRPEEIKQKISQAQIGKVISEETRAKISEAGKGRPSPRKDVILSDEIKEKISISRIGKNAGQEHHGYGLERTEETKNKISKANKGKNIGASNPFYGKTHTNEVREKLRLINLGNAPHTRPFSIQSPEGKIYTGINLNKFCKENNLSPSCMCLVRAGKSKSHKGWIFISSS